MFRKFLLIALGLSLLTFSSVTCSGDDPSTSSGQDDNDAVDDDDVTDDDDTGDDDDDDAVDDNDDDLTWVSIPAGSFEMGCSPGDSDCYDGEEPRHTVNVGAFKMTETEITQSQYEDVIGENPSRFEGCSDCPVEIVSWYDAKEFCEAVGGRLPSEAEWEYAARAGTTTKYYCGDDASCLDSIAWYYENSDDKTHPVGQKDANEFGLYDMLCNVWEWNEDCWHEDYNGAPNDGGVWAGEDCDSRVLRGGSWRLDDSRYLRASIRGGNHPGISYGDLGFRCAR